MKLFICEKPAFTRTLLGLGIIDEHSDVVHTYSYGLWGARDPKINFEAIPYTGEPDFSKARKRHLSSFLLARDPSENIRGPKRGLPRCMHQEAVDNLVEYLRNNASSYSEVICIVDNDSVGVGAADQFIERIQLPETTPIYRPIVELMTDHALKSAFENRHQHPWKRDGVEGAMIQRFQIKSTFDYWWKHNSRLVLSELCSMVGMDATRTVNYFEMMVMGLFTKGQTSISERDLLNHLQDWNRQTTLYIPIEGDIYLSIIERGGLIKSSVDDKREFHLSSNGEEFLRRTHPKTLDPHLASRIGTWVQNGDIKAMKTYIRTVFGRQLRYQRKLA